ncbi:unnamed protein product [Malus baccata var. baccata]
MGVRLADIHLSQTLRKAGALCTGYDIVSIKWMVLGSRDATFTFSNGFYLYGVCGFFFLGSTQVAEKLMIMYEECLDCNFKSIESLKEANQRKVAVPHVGEVANDDDDDSDEDNDDGDHSMGNDDSSNMMVDIPEAHSNLNPVNVSGNEPKPKPAAEAEDGWEVVGTRKHRGKRN